MSSHVVVIDQTARRHTIKVSPETVLNTIFLQACKKAGVADSSNYGLRHSNRALDLSLPFRFTKLPAGAKLELIQLPKGRTNEAKVTVALQMMDGNGSRLTHKFPSTTSVWSILRTFESNSENLGVRGINLTEAATPSGNSGNGRLFYSMPVVQIVNRELGTFEDLQLTLSAMGFHGGTALLRLKFKPTEIPLETALDEIGRFSGIHGPIESGVVNPSTQSNTTIAVLPVQQESTTGPSVTEPKGTERRDSQTQSVPAETPQPSVTVAATTDKAIFMEVKSQRNNPGEQDVYVSESPISFSVFKPPQASTPSAAKIDVDDSEFDLTISQAKQFQAHLAASARPQRLLSEDELREKERISREAKEKHNEVEIKIRFPDQMVVQATFRNVNTTGDLYNFVRQCLRYPDEPFYLYVAPPVRRISPTSGRLVLDSAFTHRTLINFSWQLDDVSRKVLAEPPLNDKCIKDAQIIRVPESVAEVGGDENEGSKKRAIMGGGVGNSSGTASSGSKLPKWLKLPGKK